jgi:hypothetical protein
MSGSAATGKLKEVPVVSQPINIALKAKYAAYSTLIFFLVANPETYKMLQKFLGGFVEIASPGGCPTPVGFFLQTGVFFLVLWAFMLFPRDH